MGLLQKSYAIGNADGRSDDFADKFLLETVHAQVIGQSKCLDEKSSIVTIFSVNIHQSGLKVLLQQNEDSRRDPSRHRNFLTIKISVHLACCVSDFPKVPA